MHEHPGNPSCQTSRRKVLHGGWGCREEIRGQNPAKLAGAVRFELRRAYRTTSSLLSLLIHADVVRHGLADPRRRVTRRERRALGGGAVVPRNCAGHHNRAKGQDCRDRQCRRPLLCRYHKPLQAFCPLSSRKPLGPPGHNASHPPNLRLWQSVRSVHWWAPIRPVAGGPGESQAGSRRVRPAARAWQTRRLRPGASPGEFCATERNCALCYFTRRPLYHGPQLRISCFRCVRAAYRVTYRT